MVRILAAFFFVLFLSSCVTEMATSMMEIKVASIDEVAKSCEQGDMQACKDAARRYRYGSDAPVDKDLAAKYYGLGCTGNDRESCRQLYKMAGDMYRAKELKRDDPKLLDMYRDSCSGDYGPGCAALGYNYHWGKGVKKDLGKALELYDKGCSHGSTWGCAHAGMFYEEGNHVTRDLAKAKSYYEKGCRGEEALACARIGLMYMQGNGVPQNYDLAFTYLEKSCQGALDDRNNAGCYGLAQLYEQGLGCQQDKEQAVKLYRLTCYGVEPKNAEGCVKLAKAYQSGEGIEPDANAVHEYFRQACDLGSREGCVGRYTDECDRLKIPQACEWLKKEGLY